MSAEDHDENQLDEYSDGSDSSDLEVDIVKDSENAFSFLRTTRSGRSITIKQESKNLAHGPFVHFNPH